MDAVGAFVQFGCSHAHIAQALEPTTSMRLGLLYSHDG